MNKYQAVNADVREALAASGLELYPESYEGNIVNETRFGRFSTIFPNSEPASFSGESSLEGFLMVRLFSESKYAGELSFEDAGVLDEHLQNKQFTNKTRFMTSTVDNGADRYDPENESLSMVIYRIPFRNHR